MSILLTVATMYALWCVAAIFIQDRLIFPGAWMLEAASDPQLPVGGLSLARPLESGGEVEAWFVPARRAPAGGAPLIVLFHGNGELIDDSGAEAGVWSREGYAVLLVEYRGYGRSAGRPTRDAIREDALWFLAQVVEHEAVDSRRVVYVGRSLGGAVAADLVAHRPPAAIVLESAFTDMGAMFLRAGLPGFLARHPYNPRSALGAYDGPILLVHGERDGVIPVSHGRALARALPRAIYHEAPVGHYPSVEWAGYDDAIRTFLRDAGIVRTPERGAFEGE